MSDADKFDPTDLSAQSGPIQADFREQMNVLAQVLDEHLNGPGGAKAAFAKAKGRPVGFFLTTYYMNEPGRFNYISNSEKLDVRAMLKEITARIEARYSAEGKA